MENSDVNGDGEINPKDATRIIKWFCGYDVELIASYPPVESI
jgi:hypothetical protein